MGIHPCHTSCITGAGSPAAPFYVLSPLPLRATATGHVCARPCARSRLTLAALLLPLLPAPRAHAPILHFPTFQVCYHSPPLLAPTAVTHHRTPTATGPHSCAPLPFFYARLRKGAPPPGFHQRSARGAALALALAPLSFALIS